METDDILKLARERYDKAVDAESNNRSNAEEDLRFSEGEQWPEDIRNKRESEGRPALVINRIPAYTRQVINDIRQLKSSIKVRGVDSGSDPATAEMLNGMIRAIEQDSNADSAYDWGAEYAVRSGEGYWRVDTDYADETGFDQIIQINRIKNPFSVKLDPDSEQADGSDAKWGFIDEYKDREYLENKYKMWDGDEWSASEDLYDDWYTKDKARVAEYWCVEEDPITYHLLSDGNIVEGELTQEFQDALMLQGLSITATRKATRRRVIHRLITATKILEETDWLGKYIPIVRTLGEEIVIDGEVLRKGMVRDMKDPQRQYNYWRSASVERGALTAKAPYIGQRGVFADPKWKQINAENYAYVEYDGEAGERPFRDPAPEISSAFVAEVQQAAEELKAIPGIYDPALGAQSNEIAGVAINARQRESDVSNFHYVDNLSRAKRYTGKILVDLIPKIYTGARMVTILEADGSERSVQLNQPYVDDQGKERNYNLTAGRYDVVVDVGPSYTTQRQEAVSSMLEIAKAFPQAVSVMGDLIAKNMDWPEADEIAKRLKTLLPPQILKGESPQISMMLNQFEQEKRGMSMLIQQLQEQIKKYDQALMDKDRELSIKEAELLEKRRANDQDHVEGMTKLEIDAVKDLGVAGRAY